jgi:hypothetical protein
VQNSEHPQALFIYNYRDNTWSLRDLEGEFRHARFGDSPNDRDAGWDDLQASWGQNRASWLLAGDAPFDGILFGAWKSELHNIDPEASGVTDIFASERGAYWDDNSTTWDVNAETWASVDVRADYQRRDTVLTRTDLPILGMEGVSTITRIYPLVNGTAPLQIRVGSQQQAGGPVKWAGDYRPFLPSRDRKIDVRTTGELHAYEIKSKSGEYFDFTGMDIEFTPAGQR